jgi:hypothetical protein
MRINCLRRIGCGQGLQRLDALHKLIRLSQLAFYFDRAQPCILYLARDGSDAGQDASREHAGEHPLELVFDLVQVGTWASLATRFAPPRCIALPYSPVGRVM